MCPHTHYRCIVGSAALAAAAAIVPTLSSPDSASASPYFNFTILGRVQGTTDPFSPTLAVSAGDLVEYQIIGNLSPLGTTHASASTGNRTITSLNVGPDGANSLSLDLFQLSTDPIQSNFLSPGTLNADPTAAANDSWSGSYNPASGGLVSTRSGTGSSDLTSIRPTHEPGVFTGIAPELIMSGVFGISSAANGGTTSLVRGRGGPLSSAIHINGSTNTFAIFPTKTSETGADPYYGFVPMTLTYKAAAGSEWNVDANGDWSTSGNWVGSVPSGAGAIANLKGAIGSARTINNDSAHTVGNIVIDNGSASYTIGGSVALTLDATSGQASVTALSGSHTISAPLVLAKSSLFNVAAPSSVLTVSGSISGANSISKLGAGTLVLSGSNTYTGSTTVGGGAVIASSDSSFGAAVSSGGGGITLDSGTIKAASSFTSDRSLTITGASGYFDTNGNTITFNGAGDTAMSNPDLWHVLVTGGGTLKLARTGGNVAISPGTWVQIDPGSTFEVGGSVDPLRTGVVGARIITLPGSLFKITGETNPGTVDGGGIPQSLPGGTVQVASGGKLKLGFGINVDTLTLDGSGSVQVMTDLNSAKVSFLSTLNQAGGTGAWTSKFDVGAKALVLKNGGGAGSGAAGQTVTRRSTDQAKTGLNLAGGSKWLGNGITSSSAAADSTQRRAVGVVQNNKLSAALYAGTATDGSTTDETASNILMTTLSGVSGVSINDTLVKYTYFGDANLDGAVNATDYSYIDAGFATGSSGWINGDFDYSGAVNSNDFMQLDLSYFALSGSLPSGIASLRLSQFGQGYMDAFNTAAPSVPEPTGIAGLGLAAATLASRRRRRSRCD